MLHKDRFLTICAWRPCEYQMYQHQLAYSLYDVWSIGPAIPYRIAVILLDKTYNTLNCTCFTQRWANKSSSEHDLTLFDLILDNCDLLIRLIAEELIQQYYHQDHHHLKNQTFLCPILNKADPRPAKYSQYQK